MASQVYIHCSNKLNQPLSSLPLLPSPSLPLLPLPPFSRQMHLADDTLLRYQYLRNFERDMLALDEQYSFLTSGSGYISRKHDGDKLFVFERGGLVWVFNFHPTQSFADYRIAVEEAGEYKVVLNSDAKCYDGHGRLDESVTHHSTPGDWDGRGHSILVYIPSRVAIVLHRV